MECTGERYLPEFDGDWTLEHVHRYLFACNLIEGKTVLDIACGDGYGSSMMANYADYVIGVDIDLNTVERAKKKYHKDNLCFIQGDVRKIPLNNDA